MTMTSMNITHTRNDGQSHLASLLSPLAWLRRFRERQELLALLDQPDYILKDIGLQRHEITQEGLKRIWTL
jgi:uncharacterized protein YjiS (DUF1127 family)